MRDIEKILNALRTFPKHNVIVYDAKTNETITFQDVVDFVIEQKAEIERLTEQHLKLMDEHDEYGNLAVERLIEIEKLKAKNAELQKQVDELKGKICELVADKCKLVVKEKQAVKDTAKEIFAELFYIASIHHSDVAYVLAWAKEKAKSVGVEVEQ